MCVCTFRYSQGSVASGLFLHLGHYEFSSGSRSEGKSNGVGRQPPGTSDEIEKIQITKLLLMQDHGVGDRFVNQPLENVQLGGKLGFNRRGLKLS